ncbi:hypothetical protein BDV96DRAFT_653127 [Lophiotrema nucula]|uniref:Uncharacterized protein n=1 Tax=Lophiotrema nucula TaxID=690887 RepID=A0A6A5YPX2_9PLEO|nr:hypothetical protein BDV96DRAFT_653127 [Lophiotrema nucula]
MSASLSGNDRTAYIKIVVDRVKTYITNEKKKIADLAEEFRKFHSPVFQRCQGTKKPAEPHEIANYDRLYAAMTQIAKVNIEIQFLKPNTWLWEGGGYRVLHEGQLRALRPLPDEVVNSAHTEAGQMATLFAPLLPDNVPLGIEAGEAGLAKPRW